jgi:hypothetical protein
MVSQYWGKMVLKRLYCSRPPFVTIYLIIVLIRLEHFWVEKKTILLSAQHVLISATHCMYH